MDDKFVVKDSGVRQEYESGMRRDTQEGKPDYTLIHIPFLTRIAEHLGRGMVKYGRDNWKYANSEEELTRFRASATRHLMQWLEGEIDEDHAAAVVFNLMAAEYVKEKLKYDTEIKDISNPRILNVYELELLLSDVSRETKREFIRFLDEEVKKENKK